MYTNIILTILTVILLTGLVSIFIWWRKYGKTLMNTVNKLDDLKVSLPKFDSSAAPQNIGDMFDRLKKISEMIGKQKN